MLRVIMMLGSLKMMPMVFYKKPVRLRLRRSGLTLRSMLPVWRNVLVQVCGLLTWLHLTVYRPES